MSTYLVDILFWLKKRHRRKYQEGPVLKLWPLANKIMLPFKPANEKFRNVMWGLTFRYMIFIKDNSGAQSLYFILRTFFLNSTWANSKIFHSSFKYLQRDILNKS